MDTINKELQQLQEELGQATAQLLTLRREIRTLKKIDNADVSQSKD